jgi:hypothetical protein
MRKAGHADMRTTQRYLHLAGVVFRDEADTLERRLLGTKLSTELSTDLSASQRIERYENGLNKPDSASAD